MDFFICAAASCLVTGGHPKFPKNVKRMRLTILLDILHHCKVWQYISAMNTSVKGQATESYIEDRTELIPHLPNKERSSPLLPKLVASCA